MLAPAIQEPLQCAILESLSHVMSTLPTLHTPFSWTCPPCININATLSITPRWCALHARHSFHFWILYNENKINHVDFYNSYRQLLGSIGKPTSSMNAQMPSWRTMISGENRNKRISLMQRSRMGLKHALAHEMCSVAFKQHCLTLLQLTEKSSRYYTIWSRESKDQIRLLFTKT